MLPQEIIRKKRDGKVLDPAEIAFMVKGLTEGSVSEGQVAALRHGDLLPRHGARARRSR